MTAKERREREKTALRSAILHAAKAIATDEGWSAVSIRKIAERVEYSPPMVYEYFDDKEALLYTLKREAFAALHVEMKASRAKAATHEEAVFVVGEAYWDFALANPQLYRVMHGLDGVPFGSADSDKKPPEVMAVIGETIEALTVWGAADGIAFGNVEDAFLMLWASLHGMLTLYLAGAYAGDPAHLRGLIRGMVGSYLRDWRVNPP